MPVYWLKRGSLEQRLSLILPLADITKLQITTIELSGNASFVNYVRHHRLIDSATGLTLDVIEKSIRKIAGISSLEARFYRDRGFLTHSVHFKHPKCFGLIETACESIIFMEYVEGKAPRMRSIAKPVALGIAELEDRSAQHLENASLAQSLNQWQMDFFRPWYLLRPRFNYRRHLPDLHLLAAEDSRFLGLEDSIRAIAPTLQGLARTAKASKRCICHQDYLRKNLFLSQSRLYLIDWSEVKIGRIGFDSGAYLSGLLRRSDLASYSKARNEFLEVYEAQIPAGRERDSALQNVRYVFLLHSLWHFMRPETAEEHRVQDKMVLLKEKFDYLIELAQLPTTIHL